METTIQPKVKDYFCYRKFLSDFYDYKKNTNANYSYRLFANRAGINSPGHLKMVIGKQRNLGSKTLPKYLQAIGFKSKTDTEIFKLLVEYDHAEQHDTKALVFQKLIQLKNKGNSNQLLKHQYNLLSQWHISAVYVLIGINSFKATAENIFSQLYNSVDAGKVHKALQTLLTLNMIQQNGEEYEQLSGSISVPDEIQSISVNQYHKGMIEQSLHCLQNTIPAQRDFNGVTMALSAEKLEMLKDKLNEFRKEVNEITSDDKNATHVYQLNMNLFPLTKGVQQ